MIYPLRHHHIQPVPEPVRFDVVVLLVLMWIIFLGAMFLLWQKAST